jgi:hypothetical protein
MRDAGDRYDNEGAMKQNGKHIPAKSRDWLEEECLKLAKQTRSGREIQRVTIRRLNPKGSAPNWKVADLIPQPAMQYSADVRAALAHLPGTYALEGDRD